MNGLEQNWEVTPGEADTDGKNGGMTDNEGF